jgi:flagellum-specific peptidoglycan hydrolase FlgJ
MDNMSYEKRMPQINSMSIRSILTQTFHKEEAALAEVASSTFKIKYIAEEKVFIRTMIEEVSISLTIYKVPNKCMIATRLLKAAI